MKWISVKDRLPKDKELVLLSRQGKYSPEIVAFRRIKPNTTPYWDDYEFGIIKFNDSDLWLEIPDLPKKNLV